MEQKTAHHYLEEIGWGSYNLKVFLQCGVVSFKQAWTTDMLWSANVAYILVGAKDEFNLTGVQTGILGAGFPLGLMIGAFYWGLTGDKYGRMYAFKNTVSVASMFSLVLTFACTPWIVVASLFFLGFGMAGELSLGGTVFLEFCPPSKHYLLTRMALFWGLGGTLSALTALVIILINVSVIPAWRLISGIGFLIEAVCACFRFSLEETPAFHHEAGNLEHMENVLNNISMENNANEFNLMKRNNPDGFDEREPQAMHMIKKLFKGKHLVSTLSFALMYSSAAFAYTSILYFMPEFLSKLTILQAYGVILLQQVCSVPGIILGSYLVETWLGRRYTISVSFVLASGCCVLFYFQTSFVSVILNTSLLNLVAIMGYSAMYTITPESYPTKIRNLGVGAANISARIAAIICPIVTGWLLSTSSGSGTAILVFAGCFLITSLSSLPLRETRPSPITEELLVNS